MNKLDMGVGPRADTTTIQSFNSELGLGNDWQQFNMLLDVSAGNAEVSLMHSRHLGCKKEELTEAESLV